MIFSGAPAFANKLSNIYQVEVPLASQTEDLKEQAIQDGFLQVLVRLSGNPNIDTNPVIKENLNRADYYVQDLTYSNVTTSSSEYNLQIRFDVNDINRLLRKAKIAVWNTDARPLTLVFLAISNLHDQTIIVNNAAPGNAFNVLSKASDQLGLPLIFPMLDIDELNGISTNDIKAMVVPTIKNAALRYSPDAILIGSMDETPTGWESQWELISNHTRWQWRITDKSGEGLLKTALKQSVLTLSKVYVVGKPDNA